MHSESDDNGGDDDDDELVRERRDDSDRDSSSTTIFITIFIRSSHTLNSIVTFTKHNKLATNVIQVQNTCIHPTQATGELYTMHDVEISVILCTSFKTNEHEYDKQRTA